jgi:hypothetical protein
MHLAYSTEQTISSYPGEGGAENSASAAPFSPSFVLAAKLGHRDVESGRRGGGTFSLLRNRAPVLPRRQAAPMEPYALHC